MPKHRVKVQYVTEVEAETQQKAVALATEGIPGSTTNVHIECWTPKEKGEAAQPEPLAAVA